ncbi:NLR family CARD domain-containing protein 3 [Lampris incognitus]|uniref:NLR family CARD domain-containing protein 3 n=1 Tax=Lampris incognitus TaxID=2546036 RepID=UPI0024B4F76E|nr:NLR family CARD domain-containing protein 3 [Lampris incognitus]
MDSDAEVERALQLTDGRHTTGGTQRPPSSYGSMRSDDVEADSAGVLALPETPSGCVTGLQLVGIESPETIYTLTTQHSKNEEACIIETWSLSDPEDLEEIEEEDDDIVVADSPEPPPPLESEELIQTEDEDCQPGRPHPEQDLSYIFKSIQSVLSVLSKEDLTIFIRDLYRAHKKLSSASLLDCDVLDLVDKMIEVLGLDNAVRTAISTLQGLQKTSEANELKEKCSRGVIRFHMKQYLIRKHQYLYEGVTRHGRHNLFDAIYVEPQISTCGHGGVDPYHELRLQPPMPCQVPSPDSFVGVNNLFHLKKDNSQRVRTVLTTGIPGIGLSVVTAKFCRDWAQDRFNRDMQFVIPLSFSNLWILQNYHLPPSKKMSLMEVIQYYYVVFCGTKYLEEPDCRCLIIMDSYDCYQDALDWKSTPIITDIYTPVPLDTLIVNLIRGNLLPAAHIWILGRRAAVSDIPAELIDVVTEIQGYSDEMKDNFLTQRFDDKELAAKIVAHYRCTPSLKMLCRQPLVCWMAATLFERFYQDPGYGQNPPKLTPFYIHFLVIQTNRKLCHYYGQQENNVKWSDEDRCILTKMGKMALKMLEKNTNVFSEEDVEEVGLGLKEVTVFSGLCTELPTVASHQREFCFIHFTYQEFMAAVYIFTMFRLEGKNVLEHHKKSISRLHMAKDESRLAVMFTSALKRTLSSPFGQYDMTLRFLSGMLSPLNHIQLLRSFLFEHSAVQVSGQEEVERLLEKKIQSAPVERVDNLKECLRELTQKDI